MSHRYLETLTTDGVRAAQERHGSRTSMDRLVRGWDTDGLLGPEEIAYIASRDGFYLATVGETGWPYLQYRGGPPGFARTPDASTIAWADRTRGIRASGWAQIMTGGADQPFTTGFGKAVYESIA